MSILGKCGLFVPHVSIHSESFEVQWKNIAFTIFIANRIGILKKLSLRSGGYLKSGHTTNQKPRKFFLKKGGGYLEMGDI